MSPSCFFIMRACVCVRFPSKCNVAVVRRWPEGLPKHINITGIAAAAATGHVHFYSKGKEGTEGAGGDAVITAKVFPPPPPPLANG